MPTYDYRCRECGHTIEIVHSILDDGPSACERCRGRLQRVVHPTGVIFKGRGFYVTDSRSSSSTPTGESPSDGGSEPRGSGSEAGGGKPAGDGKPAGGGKPAGD